MSIERTSATEYTPSPSLNEFVPKKKFANHPDNPLSESEFNWLFKQRENNGFAEAFVKFSARGFLVHIPTFTKKLNAKRGL